MQSLSAEVGSNGAPVVAAASADKLDETLVAQAIQCVDMEMLRNNTPHVRSYQASVPAALDPKTSDALDRLGVVLASTQLRIVGQTCTPKQIHVVRLSPNSMWLDFSVQDTVKTNGHFVVANLGPGAQVNCEWFYPDPPNVFSGRPERVDPGKFRAIRCTAPSQLSMRMNVAFATPSIDDDDARRRAVANKYTLIMLVFCHDKNPKPTPIASAAATTSVSTKRKITAAPPAENKATAEHADSDVNDEDSSGDESKPNGRDSDSKEELWTSAESVKLAVTRQRDKLRTATGADLNALKALAIERGKGVEDIITGVSWWVLGRASALSRSLGSFFLSKPYDWFDVVYARLPLESRRPTPAFTAANEAILQPYVFNILTVLINNVGLVPQWTVHQAKLLEKYRAQLKKFKVLEIMGSEPFIDSLANECTVFTFQKAFSFLFCIRMLRYVTPDQLLRMSPAGVVDAIKPKLDEYLRCKDGNKHKPADSGTKQVKRKVEEDEDSAEQKTTDEEKTTKKKKKKPSTPDNKKKKKKTKKERHQSKDTDDDDDNDDGSAEEEEEEEEEDLAVKKKAKTKKTKAEKAKTEKSAPSSSGGKEKALLAVSKTASKAPVDTKSSPRNDNDDDDDDDEGITVSMVMPTGMLQANIQQQNYEEYLQLMKVTRGLVKSGDEKQISEYDWVAAAETMQRVRPPFDKLVPTATNRVATAAIDLGSKSVLKVRPVGLLKTSLLHIVNINVQSFLSKLINAECNWDMLKTSDNRLPSFETRTACAYQFASTVRPSDAKDQVYVVEMQFHPGVHRISSVGVFAEPNITGPKINRLLDSSLFAEIWYTGPLPELERLKLDLDRIAGVVSAIEQATQ